MKNETRSALPLQPSALIGRADDIAAVKGLLESPVIRLVSLTGAPGTGKTSLAMAVAREVQPLFDNIAFVELAMLRDPAIVPEAIADVLGVRTAGRKHVKAALEEHLRDSSALLVLDNMEQVLPAGATIAELLSACPRLKLLVTSRAALRLRWEREFPVSPLSLPAVSLATDAVVLRHNPAVQLFLERARAASPSFELTDENAGAVAELCIRTGGLPLGIELAATQIKLLTPAAILERLKHRLTLPDLSPRDAPARHRSLEAAIDWSYSLLPPLEQALFRRSGVFADGFTCDTAAAVCLDEAQPSRDVLPATATLVEHHLLAPDGRSSAPRFRMLETIRDFALERLQECGEYEGVQKRHGDCFLALAEAAEPELWQSEAPTWLDSLSIEQANLRQALDYFGSREVAAGLRMAASLWRFWELTGHLSEGRGRLQSLLETAAEVGEGPSPSHAAAFLGAGYLARDQGDLAVARERFEQSLAMARRIDDTKAVGSAERALALLALASGDLDSAETRFEAALDHFRRIDHQLGVGWVLRNLGVIAQARGRFEEAATLFVESLTILTAIGDEAGVARCLGNLGILARIRGDFVVAERHLEESLARQEHSGDQRGICMAVTARAVLWARKDVQEKAGELLWRSIAVAESIGDVDAVARSVALLGAVLVRREMPAAGLTLIATASVHRPPYEVDEAELVASAQARAEQQTPPEIRNAAWAEGVRESLSDAVARARKAWSDAGTVDTSPQATGRTRILSMREVEVLRAVATGATNREIAHQLVLSEYTVMRHVSNILRKLDAPSRAAAISSATRSGII